jgi:hypothetical protein
LAGEYRQHSQGLRVIGLLGQDLAVRMLRLE